MTLNKQSMSQYVLLLALSFIFSHANATSKAEFLKLASEHVGSYTYIGEAQQYCDSGYLLFIDELKPESGLLLSAKIFFGPFAEKSVYFKEQGYCAVTEAFYYSHNAVKQITKVHDCPHEDRQDQGVATQSLEFSNNKLIYKSLESNIECHYKKVTE